MGITNKDEKYVLIAGGYMIERFILRSTNYVYVFHSGLDFGRFMFMGMTPKAYETAKGSYRVSCFISQKDSYAETIDKIEEDFAIKDPQLRNLPKSVKKEESFDCAKEFYSEIVPKLNEEYSSGISMCMVVNRYTNRAIRLDCPISDILLLQHTTGLNIVSILEDYSVMDVSSLTSQQVRMRSALDFNIYCNKCLSRVSDYVIVNIIDGKTSCLVKITGCKKEEVQGLKELMRPTANEELVLEGNLYLV